MQNFKTAKTVPNSSDLTYFWIGQTIISLVYLALSILLFIKFPEWSDQ